MAKKELAPHVPYRKTLYEKQAVDIELAAKIREHVQSQLHIWKQIPNWMLETDGITGYSSDRQLGYRNKVYPILQDDRGYTLAFIDLRTGEILADYERGYRRLADNKIVLEVDHAHLDAAKLLEELKNEAKGEYFGGYNPRKVAQERVVERKNDAFLKRTLPYELSFAGQKESLLSLIKKINSAASLPDADLNLTQVSNVIGHILRATNYDDYDQGALSVDVDFPGIAELGIRLPYPPRMFFPPTYVSRGAQELIQYAGHYVQLESKTFGNLFSNFCHTVWHTATQVTAEIRQQRKMKDHAKPPWVYGVLGEEYVKRAGGNRDMYAGKPKRALRPETEIGTKHIFTAKQIVHWLINTNEADVRQYREDALHLLT